jgi:vacuolar-type H+-ATPase subunit F/Vma7
VSAIVALGERRHVEGFALAGVRVVTAEDEAGVRTAWEALGPEVAVVLLTSRAQKCLADLLSSRPEAIWTVIPD